MSQKKRITPAPQVTYDQNKEPIPISRVSLRRLMRHKEYCDLLGLYVFYYHTAKWQTNGDIARATNSYVAKGIHCGLQKISRLRKILKEMNLIEDIHERDEDGNITRWYVKIKYVDNTFGKNKNLDMEPECKNRHCNSNENKNLDMEAEHENKHSDPKTLVCDFTTSSKTLVCDFTTSSKITHRSSNIPLGSTRSSNIPSGSTRAREENHGFEPNGKTSKLTPSIKNKRSHGFELNRKINKLTPSIKNKRNRHLHLFSQEFRNHSKFRDALNDWEEYLHSEKRTRLSLVRLKTQKRQLDKVGCTPDDWIERIEHSISGGYSQLYPVLYKNESRFRKRRGSRDAIRDDACEEGVYNADIIFQTGDETEEEYEAIQIHNNPGNPMNYDEALAEIRARNGECNGK